MIQDALVIPREYFAFKHLSFVLSAVSKDETRFELMHMQVRKDDQLWRYVATDGRRLHTWELDPGMFDDDMELLEPGHYVLIQKSTRYLVIKKSQHTVNFPKWQDLGHDIDLPDVTDIHGAEEVGKLLLRTDQLFNVSFISEALGYGSSTKPSEAMSVSFGRVAADGALVIEHAYGRAMVMPMKDDEEPSVPQADDGEDDLPGMDNDEVPTPKGPPAPAKGLPEPIEAEIVDGSSNGSEGEEE